MYNMKKVLIVSIVVCGLLCQVERSYAAQLTSKQMKMSSALAKSLTDYCVSLYNSFVLGSGIVQFADPTIKPPVKSKIQKALQKIAEKIIEADTEGAKIVQKLLVAILELFSKFQQ